MNNTELVAGWLFVIIALGNVLTIWLTNKYPMGGEVITYSSMARALMIFFIENIAIIILATVGLVVVTR